MLGSPSDIETDEVLGAVLEVDGVSGVHHAHFWQMNENRAALDAHVVIEKGQWARADAIKTAVKQALQNRFGVGHTTLELECAFHTCEETSKFGSDRRNDAENGHGETTG